MKKPVTLRGLGVSPGVAIGRAVVVTEREEATARRSLDPSEVPGEIERFRRAADGASAEIGETAEEVKRRLGPEFSAIFQAHALFLRDRAFLGPIEKRIETEGVNAEWAVNATAQALASRFRELPDDFALRAADLDDVARTLRKHLGEETGGVARLETMPGNDLVLVADELAPSDAVRLPRGKVIGIATERGGRTSHAAILARSFGIPAVVAIPGLLSVVESGDRVVVDGRDGVVHREPAVNVEATFRERRAAEDREETSLRQRSLAGATRTLDGTEVFVRANIELVTEVDDVLAYGADGVGLFRSEFLYLSGSGDPGVEAQTNLYREVLSRLAPRPVVIRTYDLGGKKGAVELIHAHEENPVLGLRGVRLCFKRTEMFRDQLLALLSAATAGDLRILVPMVSGVEEIRRVREILEEVRSELVDRGVTVPEHVPLGAMIEVPSAAVLADKIAPEADFLALGTNDLIQYTLAVDRANESVAELYRPQHPAVLRLIANVAVAARATGTPLSVCGEMGADPSLLPLLVGLGIREFSMGPRSVPHLKQAAREVSVPEAEALAAEALSLATADEVVALLARTRVRESVA